MEQIDGRDKMKIKNVYSIENKLQITAPFSDKNCIDIKRTSCQFPNPFAIIRKPKCAVYINKEYWDMQKKF